MNWCVDLLSHQCSVIPTSAASSFWGQTPANRVSAQYSVRSSPQEMSGSWRMGVVHCVKLRRTTALTNWSSWHCIGRWWNSSITTCMGLLLLLSPPTTTLSLTSRRWMAELGTYNFTVLYKPGRLNNDADALSRPPVQVQCSTVHALLTQGRFNVESLAVQVNGPGDEGLPTVSMDVNWAAEQRKDPVLNTVYQLVKKGQKPTREIHAQCALDVLKWLNDWSRLFLHDDILYRRRVDSNGVERKQLLCPQQFRTVVCKLLHNGMGHLGQDRTIALCQDRVFWPGMSNDVVKWIGQCQRCTCAKAPSLPQCAPLENILTSQPMEMVALDFLTLEDGRGGATNVLVMTDHFTKFATAVPTTNQTARTTAHVFFDSFVVHHGFPSRIHSDQGRNFEGRIIKELFTIAGVKKTRTTPYHPMGNGCTERFKQTLIMVPLG